MHATSKEPYIEPPLNLNVYSDRKSPQWHINNCQVDIQSLARARQIYKLNHRQLELNSEMSFRVETAFFFYMPHCYRVCALALLPVVYCIHAHSMNFMPLRTAWFSSGHNKSAILTDSLLSLSLTKCIAQKSRAHNPTKQIMSLVRHSLFFIRRVFSQFFHVIK